MSEALSAGRVRAPALLWIGAAALAALGWREGLLFAFSNGRASSLEHVFFLAAENPPWLISAVVVGLLWSRRADLRAAVGAPGSLAIAGLLLAPGALAIGWAHFVSASDLALLGAIAMAIGALYAAFGARFARLAALPIGLLLFALPEPPALTNQVIHPLQLATAGYVQRLLELLGVASTQSADVIRTVSRAFLVIEGCSGLGAMEVLTLLSLAWAWISRASLRRTLILVAAAPVIAFALNGFRVVGLVVLPEDSFWADHTLQGVVSFAIGTGIVALLDRQLERFEPPPAPERGAAAPLPSRPPLGLVVWLAAVAAATLLIPRFETPHPTMTGPLLRTLKAPWQGRDLKIDRLFEGSLRFDRSERRLVTADPAPIGMAPPGKPARIEEFVGESWRDRVASLRSPKNRVQGRGWVVEEVRATPVGRRQGERIVARSGTRQVVSLVWYANVESTWREALRSFLALDQSPFRRANPGYVARLTIETNDEDGGPERAEQRLLRHAAALPVYLLRGEGSAVSR